MARRESSEKVEGGLGEESTDLSKVSRRISSTAHIVL